MNNTPSVLKPFNIVNKRRTWCNLNVFFVFLLFFFFEAGLGRGDVAVSAGLVTVFPGPGMNAGSWLRLPPPGKGERRTGAY